MKMFFRDFFIVAGVYTTFMEIATLICLLFIDWNIMPITINTIYFILGVWAGIVTYKLFRMENK